MKGAKRLNRRRRDRTASPVPVRLRLEALEDRTLLSVDTGLSFDGISYIQYYPPDTIGASGYDYVIEAVNLTIRYYDKHSGSQLSSQTLQSFFGPLGGVLNGSDPVVTFDSQRGQFVVGMLDYSTSQHSSRFDFAVSNDANPFDGWQLRRYDMNDGTGGFELADYPRLGYNADAWVVSCNMFLNGSSFHHVDTLAIDKGTLTGYRHVVPGGSSNFTLFPVTTQDANPGAPEILVERGTSTTLKLYQMAETGAPTLLASVSVPSYSSAPNAPQPEGNPSVETLGDRVMSAAGIYGQILVAQTVNAGGAAHARWYQIDATRRAPYLYQTGDVNTAPGVYTYMPSITMNREADIGLTYMESSSSEYVSMYVTGQSVYDSGSGAVQTPVAVFPGTSHYTLSRAGDYSGITVDPSDGYSFWAANEYKGSSPWNTGITNFGVSPQSAVAGEGGKLTLHPLARLYTQAALITAPTAPATAPPAEPVAAPREKGPAAQQAIPLDALYAPPGAPNAGDAAAAGLVPPVPVVDGGGTGLADQAPGPWDPGLSA